MEKQIKKQVEYIAAHKECATYPDPITGEQIFTVPAKIWIRYQNQVNWTVYTITEKNIERMRELWMKETKGMSLVTKNNKKTVYWLQ